MKIFLWLIVSFLFAVTTAHAGKVDITASGGWSAVIGSPDLVAGAGSDIGDKESAPGVTLLTVSATGYNWRVDVSRSDAAWNANLTLYARRTSDGTGSGVVFGGASYAPLGTIGTSFFFRERKPGEYGGPVQAGLIDHGTPGDLQHNDHIHGRPAMIVEVAW